MREFEKSEHRPSVNGQPQKKFVVDVSQHELLMNRLVCNELAVDERARFLQEVVQTKNGWREIALAFLEEQSIGNAVGSTQESLALPRAAEFLNRRSEVPPSEKKPSAPDPNETESTHRAFNSIWVTAASVLVSLAIGVMIGNSLFQSRSAVAVSQPAIPDAADDKSPASTPPYLGKTMPVAHSTLKFPHHGTDLTTDVPLFELENWNEQWDNLIPEEVKMALYEGGYRIEPSTRFVRGRLDDERDLLVPVHQLTLKSVVQ